MGEHLQTLDAQPRGGSGPKDQGFKFGMEGVGQDRTGNWSTVRDEVRAEDAPPCLQ